MKRLIVLIASLLLSATVRAQTFRILVTDSASGLATGTNTRLQGVIGGSIQYGTSTGDNFQNHNPFFPSTPHTTTPPPNPPPLPVENIKVIAYPNPLRPNHGDRGVQFVNLEAGATIKLLTVVGEVVRTLITDSQGKVFWDGTNDNGQQVVSGIYLGFINESGKTRVTKIGVER